MEYFRIKNWEKYQHRDATRNKGMPWIKFYTSALSDYKMRQLSPCQFGLWSRLVLLVGEIGNYVPLDQRYLRTSLAPVNFRKPLDLGFMFELGLIEKIDASLDQTRPERPDQSMAPARELGPIGGPLAHSKNYEKFKEAIKSI